MTRRYVMLVMMVAAGALLVGMLSRRAPRAVVPAPAVAAPVDELALVIDGGHLAPAIAAVSKGHRVRLLVTNHGPAPAALGLAGYEDRVRVDSLPPGETRTIEFVADRPGDDFAWLVDGEPAGRFTVTGSHLVEGHR